MRSQKQKFIDLYELHGFTKSELCEHFHISRPTGDRILKRYREEGYEALDERSRKPHHSLNQTPQEIEDTLVEKRKKYRWGARKLIVLVQRGFGLSIIDRFLWDILMSPQGRSSR